MQLKILFSFLPWILFSVFYGTSHYEIIRSLVIAGSVFLLTELRNLKNGFFLSWGALVFLAFIYLAAVVLNNSWVINHVWLLLNSALAIIAWVSIILSYPFTLQYAHEQVPQYLWHQPGFIKVNQTITIVWGLCFTVAAAMYILPFGHTVINTFSDQTINVGTTLFAILFTRNYPNWYRAKKQKINNQQNRFLKGNYAPIREESDFNNLVIQQHIPSDLNGVYMRNGPNPAFEPISYTFPFDGDGMIHAIYINNQSANYRNRYVKTKGLLLEQKVGKAVYGGIAHPMPIDKKLLKQFDAPDFFKNGAFIHVIQHAHQFLALSETEPSYEIDINLNTLGEWKPGTKLPLNVCPHPRLDPLTNDLFFINYDIKPPYLSLYCINKEGKLSYSINIDKPYSTMMHDFVLTKNYILFFDCPAVLNSEAIANGENILQWRKELGTRVGIMSRQNKNDDILWLTRDAIFVFHFANAYEEDHLIYIDYVRHKYLDFGVNVKEDNRPPQLYRMMINLDNHDIKETCLSDYVVEFPTFNRSYNAQKYRYIYAPTKSNSGMFNALLKYDLDQNTVILHDFGINYEIGEAVFAARTTGNGEDDGYLMLFVYDKIKNVSEFVILDAKQMSAGPIATILLPRRVPHGLHGSWFPLTESGENV